MATDILPFNQETALTLQTSGYTHPVDFDLAWVWLGYSSKQKALNKLKNKSNFDEGMDFILTQTVKVQIEGGREVSRPFQQISLTIECFKSMGMMAGTEKGKEVRRYFLKCENAAHAKPMSTGEILVMQAQQFLALEQRQAALELENQRLQLEQQQIKADQAQLQEAVLEHDAEIGRIFEPDGMLITLAGCLNLHGLHATAAQLSSVGKAASKMYRDRYDKEPEKIGDARYGMVNAYPRAIAEQVLIDHGYLTAI